MMSRMETKAERRAAKAAARKGVRGIVPVVQPARQMGQPMVRTVGTQSTRVLHAVPPPVVPRIVELVEPKAPVPPRIWPDDRLVEIHTYMRPHGSRAERKFIRRFIVPTGAKPDGIGNMVLRVGPVEKQVVLWSAHTDTVHRSSGRQLVDVGPDGWLSQRGGSCLGADDGAGVYVLLRMIEAGVPGVYVFHRGEEVGCIGSSWKAKKDVGFFDGIRAAVAFDRKDTDEIITHQAGMRTASDAFAKSLAEAIGMAHKPSSRGMYTDTNEYTDVVDECTNVGVGYDSAHGAWETLNGGYVMELAEAMCAIGPKLNGLVFERVKGTEEYDQWSYNHRSGYGRKGWYSSYESSWQVGRDSYGVWAGGSSAYGTLDKPIKLQPGQKVPSTYSGHIEGYEFFWGRWNADQKVYIPGEYRKVEEAVEEGVVELLAGHEHEDSPGVRRAHEDPFARDLEGYYEGADGGVITAVGEHQMTLFRLCKEQPVLVQAYLYEIGIEEELLEKFRAMRKLDQVDVLEVLGIRARDIVAYE